VAYSEPIYGLNTDYSDFILNSGGSTSTRTITGAFSVYSDTDILVFDGDPASSTSTATIDINNPMLESVEDLAGNELALTDNAVVFDGQTPPQNVYVNGDYTSNVLAYADGYYLGYNSFANIQAGVDAVAELGTVNVAAGYYTDNILIDKPLILAGNSSTTTTIDAGLEDFGIQVNAGGVEVSGFTITGTSGEVPSAGIYFDGVEGCNIHDNILINNKYGMWLYGANGNTITNNDASSNNQVGFFLAGSDGNTFDSNTANSTGISFRLQAGSDSNTLTNNIVEGNIRAFHILASTLNTITNNVIVNSSQYGIRLENNSVGNNISKNWWSSDTGPYEWTYNPNGEGNTLSISNSDYNYFRPWCLSEGCTDFSRAIITPDDISALFDNGGSITPILDGENATTTIVTSLEVNEDTNINVASGNGTTTISLSAGTVITKTSGGTFEAGDVTAAAVALSSLSGFSSNEQILGAIQWGIPNLGLSFSEPITISLYVGTSLNGRTLTIKRSTSSNGGWTTDGIVAPGTCVVSGGTCTFKTTKASNYASLSVSSSGGTGGNSYRRALALASTTPAIVTSSSMTTSQFIQLLIDIGVIKPNMVLLVKIIFGLI